MKSCDPTVVQGFEQSNSESDVYHAVVLRERILKREIDVLSDACHENNTLLQRTPASVFSYSMCSSSGS
jgi:hypothetical protein